MARRLSIVALVAVVVSALSSTAAGATEIPTGWNEETGIYEMVFPIDGETFFDDSFGACRGSRCSRRHEGIDLLADKMVPVVAAAAGTVGWVLDEQGGKCCAMALNHDDGWRTWYIHLNNDTPGTDDGKGWGFAPGIAPGVHVEAGQLIGYVGDSGNAETTPPHIHFELQRPNGKEINPYPHLVAAQQKSLEADMEPEADLFVNGVLVGTSSQRSEATVLEWDANRAW